MPQLTRSARAGLAFGVHATAYFLSSFFRSANAVISEQLSAEFALSASALGFITSLFYFAIAAAQIPIGIALDRAGPRRVVPLAMVAAAGGCVLFAIAPSPLVLAAGRTLIGLGMGAVLMGAAKTLSLVYDDARYPGAFGLLVGLGTAGGFASAEPLRLLTVAVGWRNAFLIGAAAVLLVSLFVWRLTPPVQKQDRHHDDGILSSIGRILREPAFVRIAILSVFMAGGLLSIRALWAGPYLAVAHELPGLRVGTALTVATAGMVVGYPVTGRIAQSIGTARMIFGAGVAFVLCFLALALLPIGAPFWLVAVLYLLFGLTGSAEIHLITQAKDAFPAALTGRATTLVNVVAIGSSFLLQWLFGVTVDGVAAAGLGVSLGYRISFGLIALLGTATLAAYAPLVVGERRQGTGGATRR